MKLVAEILLALFLHPVAFILCVIDIVNRADIGGFWKFVWILVTFLWGIGPIRYVLVGRGKFW